MLWVKDGAKTAALLLFILLLQYGKQHSGATIPEDILDPECYALLFGTAGKESGAGICAIIMTCRLEKRCGGAAQDRIRPASAKRICARKIIGRAYPKRYSPRTFLSTMQSQNLSGREKQNEKSHEAERNDKTAISKNAAGKT